MEQIVEIKGTNYRATSTGHIINKHGRPLVGGNVNGYRQVTLRINKQSKRCLVHRLIYFAFNGEPDKGQVICHIDRDGYNNNIGNLAAVTRKHNMQNPITKRKLADHKKRYAVKYKPIENE